jgi:hypothetical protein
LRRAVVESFGGAAKGLVRDSVEALHANIVSRKKPKRFCGMPNRRKTGDRFPPDGKTPTAWLGRCARPDCKGWNSGTYYSSF